MTGLRTTWRAAPVAVRVVCASLLLSLLAFFLLLALAMDEIDASLNSPGVLTALVALFGAVSLVMAALVYGLLRRSALVWLLLLLTSVPGCWTATADLGPSVVPALAFSAGTIGALLWPSTLRWCWMKERERARQPVLDLRRPD